MDQPPSSTERLGLWHRPEANYSFGLGANGSVAALIGIIVILFAYIPPNNRVRNVAVVSAIVAVVVAGFFFRDKWDRTIFSIIRFETGWAWHRMTGRNYYAPVWFSATPVSKSSLPGLLADVSIAEFRTGSGISSTFGVIIQPASESATVVFECRPSGSDMATDVEVEEYELRWHRWLASVCQESDVISVQVVTEAAGGDPEALNLALDKLVRRPGSAAAELLESVAATLDPGSRPVCRTWVAISWKTKRRGLHKDALPSRVERLQTELAECGAGPASPLSKNQICQVWAGMWDPDRRESIARWPDQIIKLQDIAPITKETRHGLSLGAFDSLTMSMGTMPTGTIGTRSLKQLAGGVPGTVAVRWAELWRPVKPTEARQWIKGIERGIETRLALSQNRRRARIEDEVDDSRHRSVASALVEGANLVRFGFAITATVPASSNHNDVVERIRQNCGPFAVQMRVQNGAHLPGFIATMPGGIPLPEVVQAPDPKTMALYEADDEDVA